MITSFYRGLDDHIQQENIELKTATDNLFWWDEYISIVQDKQKRAANEVAQWDDDDISGSEEESDCDAHINVSDADDEDDSI